MDDPPGTEPPGSARSAAILIGVSDYQDLPPLPAVANNLDRLTEVLTDPRIWGLAATRCHPVLNPATQNAFVTEIERRARGVTGTLLLYYAGHGFVSGEGELMLTLPDSRPQADYTAVRFHHVREALQKSRAKRLVVVLDCCYSGRALGGMARRQRLRAAMSFDIDPGTYVLTAAADNVRAHSPRDEDYTAFTGEFTRALSDGIAWDTSGRRVGPHLTLDTIYRTVHDALERQGRPLPQQQDRGQVGSTPFVRNRAYAGENEGGRQPARRSAAAALTLIAVLTPAVYLGLRSDAADSGACSERASLLGFSDQLDNARFLGEPVVGLSSLASSGPDQVLALSDGRPRLFRLALEAPGGRPNLRIAGGTTLLHKDGSPYAPDRFTGEASALEPGGTSMLVASETGPSISRYDLRTGRLRTGIPVPARFRSAPVGDATRNAIFESMALSPDGTYLYVGLEAPFSVDGTRQGRNLMRILRYAGRPNGSYVPDRQFAYEAASGLRIADFAALGDEELLVLERGFTEGQGNSVHVYQVDLSESRDVTAIPSLADPRQAPDFPAKHLLVDLGECPSYGAVAKEKQANPLLTNIEGMALGPRLTEGEYAGRRPLYLVSDGNDRSTQTTRFYVLAVNPF